MSFLLGPGLLPGATLVFGGVTHVNESFDWVWKHHHESADGFSQESVKRQTQTLNDANLVKCKPGILYTIVA